MIDHWLDFTNMSYNWYISYCSRDLLLSSSREDANFIFFSIRFLRNFHVFQASKIQSRSQDFSFGPAHRGRSGNEVAQNRLGNGSIQWEQGK